MNDTNQTNSQKIHAFLEFYLKDYDFTIGMPMFVILSECIKENGLNKKKILDSIAEYVNIEKLKKCSNGSFIYQVCLNFVKKLNDDEKNNFINELKTLIESFNENDGNIIIPSINELTKTNEANNMLIINDNELGDLKLNIHTGEITKIDGNAFFKKNLLLKNIETTVEISSARITFENSDDISNDFEKNKDIYINKIKLILSHSDQINKFLLNKIWSWHLEDYEISEIDEIYSEYSQYFDIELTAHQPDSLYLSASWEFTSKENNDMSGYIDFCVNNTNNEFNIENTSIGYY